MEAAVQGPLCMHEAMAVYTTLACPIRVKQKQLCMLLSSKEYWYKVRVAS